jgi:hypothetical protein
MRAVTTLVRNISWAAEAMSSRWARGRAGVRWFDRVTPQVERAYDSLGGDWRVSLDLLALAMSWPSLTERRLAVVTSESGLVGLLPLRWIDGYWEPLLARVVPEAPAALGAVPFEDIVESVCRNVFVRGTTSDPSGWPSLRWSEQSTSYDLDLSDDPERYWRAKHRWKSITASRKRTQSLELVMDSRDAAMWTITRWRDKHWRAGRGVTSLWPDRQAVVLWGLENGQAHCWALRDGDQWVAGNIGMVVGSTLSFSTVFREPSHAWHSPGTRLFYEALTWGITAGLQNAAFGSGHDYKRYWAPQTTGRWNCIVSPLAPHLVRAAASRGTRFPTKRVASRPA